MSTPTILLGTQRDKLRRIADLMRSTLTGKPPRAELGSVQQLTPGQQFTVVCLRTGGSNGAPPSTRASFTYDVYDISGVELLLEDATPEILPWRGVVYEVPLASGAGTKGDAYFNGVGELVLYRVNLDPLVDACPSLT
jgi:hypothetical protein